MESSFVIVKGISKLISLVDSFSISMYSRGSISLIEFILFDESLFPKDFGPLIEINSSKLIISFFLSLPFSFLNIISILGFQSVETISKDELLLSEINLNF